MDLDHTPPDGDAFREQLMSRVPMHRIKALHALEVEPEAGADAARIAAAGAASRFAARGIPFYSVDEPSFCAWVDKAVALWQRLQDTQSFAHARFAPATAAASRHA